MFDNEDTSVILEKELRKMEAKRESNLKNLERLYIDKLNGLITDDEYIAFSKSFSKERNLYTIYIDDLKKRLAKSRKKSSSYEARKKIISKYINIKKLTRDIVSTLIEYIEVGRDEKDLKKPLILIHWNF